MIGKMVLAFGIIAALSCATGRAQDRSAPEKIQQLLDSADHYGNLGDNKNAYRVLREAKEQEERSGEPSTDAWITIERDLGEYARRMANLTLARKHYQMSIALVMKQERPDLYQLYQTYTSLGTVSWYASKLDSAAYFYEKAIEVVGNIDDTPLNTHYRRALLYNNIAGVYSLQGKTDRAIRTMEECIVLLEEFAATEGYVAEKKKAIPLQFEAIDNLGGAYKELGNYSKTEQLLLYAYGQKRKYLEKDDPGIFISQILLGQLYYDKHDPKKALEYLEQGREAISRTGAGYLFWDADACYALALIHEKSDRHRLASNYYQKADSLYHLAFDGSYDSFYLDFLNKYAGFRAKNGQCDTAMQSAHSTLKYVNDAGNRHSLLPFYQLRNLAELALQCGSFDRALEYAREGRSLIDAFVGRSTTLADSIKGEGEKAKVIMIRAKAEYALLKRKSKDALQPLLKDLNEAATMIERMKSTLTDHQDIRALISDHEQLTDFIKQLNFELYKRTKDSGYLLQGINVHENNLYSRMRSRMDYQNSLGFMDVPQAVLDEENRRKDEMQRALHQDRGRAEVTTDYGESLTAWQLFLKGLEKQYPHYYRMRYAEKALDIDRLRSMMSEDMTLVRYIFSGDGLYAFVMGKGGQELVSLETDGLSDRIDRLREAGYDDVDRTTDTAHELYKMLWEPIKNRVETKQVVIIPDGVLYNLSFEMLAPVATRTYAEFAQKCLLNIHTISYHYSLLALFPNSDGAEMKGNFVAFAPDFTERTKQEYLMIAKKDSLNLDRAYLSLLPLPFTAELVNKVGRLFGGAVFSDSRSTPRAFREASGYNRIIHIGTHAEMNDDYPEYSRLIFAKDKADPNADNSVYLYDIYNYDLVSDLSVLTACESGRSGFREGEGMISMAHAFNYAGSKSIMTGLWRLDEQAAVMVTGYFYANLKKGLSKDEALQQAKLTYLQNVDGRMLSPVYWAGLVIMGDMAPVELQTPFRVSFQYIGILFLLVLFLGGWWLARRKTLDKKVP